MGEWLGIDSTKLDSYCTMLPTGHNIQEALNGSDYWECNETHSHWFIIDLGACYYIQKVRSRSNTDKDPTLVSIHGSNDKISWDVLDHSITTFQDTTSWIEREISNPDHYQYIKVIIDTTEDDPRFNYLKYGGSPAFTIFDIYAGYSPPIRAGSGDGWKLTSTPGAYGNPITLSDLKFLYNGTYYTWEEATTSDNEEGTPLLDPNVWGWDFDNQQYIKIEEEDSVYPSLGYWMYFYYECEVYYPVDSGGDGSDKIEILKANSIKIF